MTNVPELLDLTGVPFETGVKVAWFIGGRYGSGMVIGVVSRMEVVDREISRYDYPSRQYVKEPVKYLEVDLTPLVKGRQKRTMKLLVRDGVVADPYGGRDVIVVANQNFEGDKA